MADDPSKPYGDVRYADPGYQSDGKKRYPLDTKEHCKAAWSYINQAGNAAKYSPEELRRIKGRIKAALKDYGVEVADDHGRSAPDQTWNEAPMSETHYRSFSPDLQVRSQGDGRTVYGIAVPYNAPTRINETLIEQFARGAFNHQIDRPSRVKFAREHVQLGGELIGAASLLRDDAAGLYVELRAAKTPAGDATLELVRDGALDQLSVAFREGRNRRLGGGVVERTMADLREVAIVMEGAYGELAPAVGVRSKQAAGAVYTEADMDLRTQAEQYLATAASRELPDYETQIRAIRLGLPI